MATNMNRTQTASGYLTRGICLATLLAGALSGMSLPAVASDRPASAFVNSVEQGQAQLLTRLGECYAVTPAHVMGKEWYASLVGQGGGAARGDGDLLQTFGYDLAILRVTGGLARNCGGALGRVAILDKLLSGASSGSVLSINADGSVTRRNVTLNDAGLLYVRMRPRTAQDELFQGLSGSLLEVAGQPVGILMSVDASTGEGKALRYDRAVETLRPFFGMSPATAATEAAPKPVDATPASQPEIASWSSSPLSADVRAANLVDGNDATTWYAVADAFPLELVFDLPGKRPWAIDHLRLIGTGVEPRQRLPKDFEVMISNNTAGNWVPVSSGTYFTRDDSKQVVFAPVRARRLMLRLYSNWGDADAVGLSGVEIGRAE